MRVQHRLFMLAKPTVSRFLVLLCLSLSATSAAAQDELTDREVTDLVLARPALRELADAVVAAQLGRARAAGAYPNPQLNYMREQTYNDAGTAEDYVSMAQVIDLGGRQRLERKSGEARGRAAAESAKLTLLGAVADARARFYECLHRHTRIGALQTWLSQIEKALEVVARREARGDAAAYDKLRLERERAVASAKLGLEQAQYEAARVKLGGLLGRDPAQLAVEGTILPDAAKALHAGQPSPAIRALEEQGRAATLSAQAAERFLIPDLRLEAGYKGVTVNAGGRTDGYLLGASISLPLWDHGSGQRAAARGEARQHAAERLLLTLELSSEIDALRSQGDHTRAVAQRFREASSRTSSALIRTATAGYEGGELGLFELLDAFRGAADDELAALDMELSARHAAIQLDRLTGAAQP
jgi:cobalt-zinc-cadmium efflux system outer membrane protein